MVEILAGIPSVMMGFIGLALLSPLVQSAFRLNTGLCGLTAAIMLSLMSLPIIVSVSEDAMHAVPLSPTDPMTTMTAAIASGIGNAVRGGLQYQALFAIGLILFILTLAVNIIAERVLERQKRKFAR
jgi:phosphate transport system permease protein